MTPFLAFGEILKNGRKRVFWPYFLTEAIFFGFFWINLIFDPWQALENLDQPKNHFHVAPNFLRMNGA